MSGETAAYQWLRSNLFKHPHRVDRVENLVVVGMPDVNVKMVGREEFWLEVKAPVEPKRQSTALFGSNHRVSQDQMNWFLRQRRAGGKAFFWIATDKRRMLLSGAYADRLNQMTMAEVTEAALWLMVNGQPFTTNHKEELLSCFNRLIS